MTRYRARRAAVASESDLARIEVQHMGSPAIGFLLSVFIIALIIYLAGRPGEEGAPSVSQAVPGPVATSTPPPPPPPSSTGATGATGATASAAFVTASIVNCRLAPAEQAPRVRKIVRGEPVAVLARDESWVSISYRGRQCWVLSRYISPVEPLSAARDADDLLPLGVEAEG